MSEASTQHPRIGGHALIAGGDVSVLSPGNASQLTESHRPAWPARAVKRTFDFLCASCALLLTAPLLLLAVIAIRIDSPGRAIFRQTRMGRDGKPFQLYKLRGMFTDARERFPDLFDYSATPDDPADFYYHSDSDPRVTRVGRVLRRFSIDELPNFVNVLKGDMSVVGPRPEIPELAHMYGDWLPEMLSVRPGITSPAKATGRDSLSLAQTIELDRYYVLHQSLWLDIKIVARTVFSIMILRGENAA